MICSPASMKYRIIKENVREINGLIPTRVPPVACIYY